MTKEGVWIKGCYHEIDDQFGKRVKVYKSEKKNTGTVGVRYWMALNDRLKFFTTFFGKSSGKI